MQIDPEVMANLTHPNILTVEDFWRDPDGAYVVTRVFGGGTLAAAVSTGSLSSDAATSVAADVDAALAAARRSRLRPRPGGPGVRPRGGRARLRARLRLRAGVAAGDGRPARARRGAVKLGHAAARCRGGVRRHVEPVQGVGSVRRGGRRRLLRPRPRHRASARPAGHHRECRTVRRRRGAERQWQVERGEGRAAAGHPQGCLARFCRVVRRPDGPQPAAIRRAGRRAAPDRRRSQG